MIKGRQLRSQREGTFLFIHFNRRRYWTHWCALVRWIHYPLLISLIKIISQRGDAEKKKTFDIWSYSSILGGCNVIFSTWSVTFPVFSLKNSFNTSWKTEIWTIHQSPKGWGGHTHIIHHPHCSCWGAAVVVVVSGVGDMCPNLRLHSDLV